MLTRYDDPELYDIRTGGVKLTKDYAPLFWELKSQDRSWADGALADYLFTIFPGQDAMEILYKIDHNEPEGIALLIQFRDHFDNAAGRLDYGDGGREYYV